LCPLSRRSIAGQTEAQGEIMRKLFFTAFVLCCLPLAATAQTYTTSMIGAGEAPAAGDPNGSGVGIVTIDGTTVHWTIVVRDLGSTITAAHIHESPAGTPGDVVIGFSPLNFVDGVASGTATGVDQALINRIKADPPGFYINVHTTQFPGGAIRGQLEQGCTQSDSTLCVNGNRFRVNAAWAANNQVGLGHAVRLTSDTGYFWFFTQENVEIVLKSLNACPPVFSNHWVFASGLTNVEVDLTVIDTQVGTFKRYQNPPDTPFETILDTAAFACP
jgi:CHRD domain-containing protein